MHHIVYGVWLKFNLLQCMKLHEQSVGFVCVSSMDRETLLNEI